MISMSKQRIESEPLEIGLRQALQALDNQIAREMQRSPSERESRGVLKWEPIESRVERVSAYLLSLFGEEIQLDSLMVLSQALVKTLSLVVEDCGAEGLGEVRSRYIERIAEAIVRDATAMRSSVTGGFTMN
jgi:hypothetical protein